MEAVSFKSVVQAFCIIIKMGILSFAKRKAYALLSFFRKNALTRIAGTVMCGIVLVGSAGEWLSAAAAIDIQHDQRMLHATKTQAERDGLQALADKLTVCIDERNAGIESYEITCQGAEEWFYGHFSWFPEKFIREIELSKSHRSMKLYVQQKIDKYKVTVYEGATVIEWLAKKSINSTGGLAIWSVMMILFVAFCRAVWVRR